MWDKVFAESGYAYGTEANDFLQAAFSVIPKGGRVLMLADGEGRNGVFMAEQGYRALSLDSSKVGLEKATLLAKQRGVELETLCVDLAEYQPEVESFDAIVSIFCHFPEPLKARVHQLCDAALKPGGYLLFESYTPKQLEYKTGGPAKAEMMSSLACLQSAFPKYRLEQGEELDRVINEGRLHNGLSAVVQLILQKPISN